MKFGTFIPPDTHHKTASLAPDAPGNTFSLESLQGLVGGYVETLTLPDGRLMLFNEDGKRLRLAPNLRATDLARKAGIAQDDLIVGAAVVIYSDQFE